jgi:hypothetical protein
MRQKDFVEHCAIILALHDQVRRLLLARQTIRAFRPLLWHDFVKFGTP